MCTLLDIHVFNPINVLCRMIFKLRYGFSPEVLHLLQMEIKYLVMSFLFRRTKLRRTAYSKDIKHSVKHEEVELKEVWCIFRVTSDINGERQITL